MQQLSAALTLYNYCMYTIYYVIFRELWVENQVKTVYGLSHQPYHFIIALVTADVRMRQKYQEISGNVRKCQEILGDIRFCALLQT